MDPTWGLALSGTHRLPRARPQWRPGGDVDGGDADGIRPRPQVPRDQFVL